MDSLLNLEVDSRGFVSESDRDAFFRHQFTLPENNTCFDCGFNNPNWTSLSFSIYLCLNCSGRHRQLGSHISFVRSIDMDRFTRDQLIRLSLGGNGKFNSFLNSENICNKPLNYTNNRLLAYSSKLDLELLKHTGKKTENVSVHKNQDLVPNVVKVTSNEDLSEPVVNRTAETIQNLQSVLSSMKDDVEKLIGDNNDTFSDLLDFGSVGNHDFNLNTSIGSSVNEVSANSQSSVALDETDNYGVFEKFESPKAEADVKFDGVSDFVDFKPYNLNKVNTNDSLNLDFVNSTSSAPPVSSSFADSAGNSDSLRSSNFKGSHFGAKGDNASGRDSRATKSKFSSKVHDFDFESFAKQNVSQGSFTNVPSSTFGSSTMGATSSAFGFASNRATPASFGAGAPTSPDKVTISSFIAASSPDSSLVTHPVSLHVKSVAPLPSGAIGFSSNTVNKLVVNDDLLSNHNVHPKPDLSKFEGKKSISSDAFFGNTSTTPKNLGNKVSPNTLAFSSDDYFGRPRSEAPPIPTIEEHAVQNLNELKENIVNALNKGSVLLEKAKQWLHTNYY